MLRHAAVGFGLSTLAVAAILRLDPGNLGTLLTRAEEHPMPVLMLWLFLGLTLGGVQTAVAVMLDGMGDQ